MIIEFPGLVDLQVNGFAGVDFNGAELTADRLSEAVIRIRQTGVSRCLPTLITSPFEAFRRNAQIIAASTDPTIAGIHMEGPYISRDDGARGAHPLASVTHASVDDFNRRQEAARGRILLVTLAPEVPGVLKLIEFVADSGVRVAIGHTAATPRQIADAISAGANLATHLGNGCASLLPRHPNVLWSLLASDEVTASLIVDGHHLPAETVRVMTRAKGSARCILITDATAAAGSPPGRYTIGGVLCEASEAGRVSLPGTEYLAGSSLTLPAAIGNTVRFSGLPLESVITMASSIPARYLGIVTSGVVTADWDPHTCVLAVRGVDDSD
jgi:N-acetylglucosamine-6-phosphate deacetylase